MRIWGKPLKSPKIGFGDFAWKVGEKLNTFLCGCVCVTVVTLVTWVRQPPDLSSNICPPKTFAI